MKNGRYEEYGRIRWYKDDVLHREDGPAVIWCAGAREWYLDGKLHRVGGPAIEYPNGTKKWCVNGYFHRLDGPAIEWEDGSTEWWVDDKEVDVLAVFGYEPSVPLSEEEQVILRLSI